MGTPGDKGTAGKNIKEEPAAETSSEDEPAPSAMTISSPPASLEQAHIEDYFGQSKGPKVTRPSKTFLSLAEPGPSGLQTPKTKLALSKLQRRSKKKSHHVCTVCQKAFPNSAKLTKHQLISHNGSSPYKCEHCKKTFSSKFKLVRHVLIHSDRRPFSCSVCERTFHRKDHLKNHIKVHSPSKKHYICEKPACKKEYTSLLSYKKHAALHAAEEGSLVCQICLKTFQTKEDVLYHLKVHAGSRTVKNPNEKKFTCDHCDRKFFTRKDVRRHLVVHTGMRDFLCQFCPQRFGRKDHLVRHIKKSHSSKKFADNIKSELSESSTSMDMPPEQEPRPVKIEISDLVVDSLFFPPLSPILPVAPESLGFLRPSTSSEAELKDLGSAVLEEMVEAQSETELLAEEVGAAGEMLEEPVLSDTDIMRLLESGEDKNLPLPGFSQTFQSPPPPK